MKNKAKQQAAQVFDPRTMIEAQRALYEQQREGAVNRRAELAKAMDLANQDIIALSGAIQAMDDLLAKCTTLRPAAAEEEAAIPVTGIESTQQGGENDDNCEQPA